MELLNELTANFEILIVLLVVAGAGIAIAQQKKKENNASEQNSSYLPINLKDREIERERVIE